MIFDPAHKDYRFKSVEYLDHLLNNGKRFELKELRKRRSLPQKGYMYLCFKQVQIDTGCDMEEVKQYLFKEVCSPEIFVRHGTYGKYLRSTEELDTKEMFEATENFRNFCAMELGIYIPAPNEHEKIRAWEAELSRVLPDNNNE